MAAAPLNIAPLEPFSLKSEDWDLWSKRFARYLTAASIAQQSDQIKIETLIYCVGSQAEEILTTFKFEQNESNESYADVKRKFDNHFVARRNIIFERAKFNRGS